MLDKIKFSATFEDVSALEHILKTFSIIHNLSDKHFYITGHTNSKKVQLYWCHDEYKGVEHYPLSVILPMIEYKVSTLDPIQDPYIGYDGSSVKAYSIDLDSGKLSITRTYLYAGK